MKKTKERDYMNVARFFQVLRVKLDMSQYEFAEMLDVDQSYIGQLEAGYYKKLPMPLIKRLYKELPTNAQKKELMSSLEHEFYDYFTS
jgi:predicted transcriptional regulator